jgi:hypothetical protein
MVFLNVPGVESRPQWVRLQSDPKLIDAAYVEEDGTFRIEGVPPGRLRISTEFEGFRGETEVDAVGGAEVEAVLRLVALGRARFHAESAPSLLPVVEVRFAGADGAWSRWTSVVGREGRLPEWTANVPAGHVTWQARFRASGVELPADAPAVVEGEIDAKVGEVADVPIAVR